LSFQFEYLLSPAEVPEGFALTTEQTEVLNLVRALQEFSLNFSAIIPIYCQIEARKIGAQVKHQPWEPFLEKLLARFYSFYWHGRFGKSFDLDTIPQNGLLIHVYGTMSKEWDLIAGVIPFLQDLPLWMIIGSHSNPEHVCCSDIPIVTEYLKMPGVTSFAQKQINSQWLQWRRMVNPILREQWQAPNTEGFILKIMARSVVMAAEICALLDATNPKLIVTIHDHQQFSSLLVFLARIRGIPTLTLQHGTLGVLIGYVPLWTDYALLWGEEHARVFRAFGTAESRIRLVGCPRLQRVIEPRETVWERHMKKWGIPHSDALVLLAPDNNPDYLRRRLAKLVWQGMQSLSDHRLIIKCHPGETKHLYQALFADESRIHIFSGDEMSIEEAISLADVVVVEYSGVAADALVMRRPVILINLDGELYANQRMADMGAVLVARSASELQSILNEKKYDWNLNPSLPITVDRYVKEFCVAFGDEASKLTAASIRDIWNRSK
jgi:hypothetical protein